MIHGSIIQALFSGENIQRQKIKMDYLFIFLIQMYHFAAAASISRFENLVNPSTGENEPQIKEV